MNSKLITTMFYSNLKIGMFWLRHESQSNYWTIVAAINVYFFPYYTCFIINISLNVVDISFWQPVVFCTLFLWQSWLASSYSSSWAKTGFYFIILFLLIIHILWGFEHTQTQYNSELRENTKYHHCKLFWFWICTVSKY